MLATMNEPETTQHESRVRVIFDTEELIRQAIQLRTMKESVRAHRSVSKSEFLTELLRAELADEIADLQRESSKPRRSRDR